MITTNPASFYIDHTYVPIGVTVSLSSVETDTNIAKHTWHFDDGDVAFGSAVTHSYAFPGVYDIKHVACDYTNRSYVTTTPVTAYTPYRDAVSISLQPSLTAGIASLLTISVTSTSPPPHNVVVYLQDSASLPARDPVLFFDHLLPYWGIYDTDDQYFTTPLNTVTIQTSAVVINESVSAAWCGTACVNIIDHSPGTPTLWATLLKYSENEAINSRAFAASSIEFASLTANTTNTYVSITHDGIEPFCAIQFAGVDVPVIVTVKDDRLSWPYIVHYLNQYGTASLTITSSMSSDDLGSFSYEAVQQCLTSTPYYKTTINTCTSGSNTLQSIVTAFINSTMIIVTGSTPSFDVKPLYNYNDFRKRNEDFDLTNALKSATPNFIVAKSPTLYNSYYPAIFGNPSTDSEQKFGIKLFERIANFITNHGDIDTCDVDNVYSKGISKGVNIDALQLAMPDEIKRIIDTASVSPQKLWGVTCGCNMTFDDCVDCCDDGMKCTLCKQQKVLNRGNLIDTTTYTVTAGTPIVFCPVQTRDFELLYTIPVSGSDTYPISAIDYTNLTEPLSSNYNFYEYDDTPAGNNIENLIDWSNCRTLLQQSSSQKQWLEDNGTVEQILRYLLVSNLQLATVQCSVPSVECEIQQCP